ncbi:MAG: alpha/beta hydrolase, partial [Deltaproteobacteria bacterium]|nr:alpha/beta hydrolase [Deltaproteobacteria bacterium]
QVMVAPPVAFIDFKNVAALSALSLIVGGSLDEYAPPALIRKMIPVWNSSAHFEVIDGADHFFFGHSDELESVLRRYL